MGKLVKAGGFNVADQCNYYIDILSTQVLRNTQPGFSRDFYFAATVSLKCISKQCFL